MIDKKNILIIYILIIIEMLILLNSNIVTNNVILSTKTFVFSIFPSLFPTMVIGNLLIKNNVFLITPKFIINIFRCLFNFNDNLTSIFIMSFITGSPSNAVYIDEYLNKGLITNKEAENILCCTHFINPLFIISTSIMIFNNVKIGFLLIIILLISNLIKAFILRNNFNSNSVNNISIKKNSLITEIKQAISGSINSILLILGIVIMFNILICLTSLLFNFSPLFKTIINGILEVTTGILSIKNLEVSIFLKIIMTYFFLSFGGLCIQLQTISMITNKKIKYFKYFIFRLI